jgi:hypothetical protein
MSKEKKYFIIRYSLFDILRFDLVNQETSRHATGVNYPPRGSTTFKKKELK